MVNRTRNVPRDPQLLDGFSLGERVRLEEVRALVELEELGGALDGLLTARERSWLAFFGWLRARRPQDDDAVLAPERATAILAGIMEHIRKDRRDGLHTE